jgi:hypothetical protein
VQRENRKLAAIVVANIVSHSRLIGQDEEGPSERGQGLGDVPRK